MVILPAEVIKVEINNKFLDVLRYEYQDPLPGGAGSWLFCFEYGMLGYGLTVGEKFVAQKIGQLTFDSQKIVDLMKYNAKAISPPPPDFMQ